MMRSVCASCVFILLAAAGCGDSQTAADAAAPADAEHQADAGRQSTAFVVAGDFTATGVASTIEVPSLRVTQNAVAGVAGHDPYVRYIDGRFYIINSYSLDNISIVDAAERSFVDQISTGAGTTPQDIAVKGSSLYVAALSAPGVLVVDAGDPQAEIETIDLSSLDDSDGIPDCNSVYLVGDLLYVTCSLLDNFVPTGPGKVAVIDTGDHTVIDTFDLVHANPVGFLQATSEDGPLGGDLLIATVDFSDLTTGCVERIATAPEPGSSGCLVENSALGGYASGMAYSPEGMLYLAVTEGYDPGPIAKMVRFDAQGDMLLPESLSPGEQSPFDLVRCPTGELVVADAAAGGVRVYDADGEELTSAALDIGLPPVSKGLSCF